MTVTQIVDLNGHGGSERRMKPCNRDDVCFLCRQIQELYRRKVATLEIRKNLDNQLGSYVARELGDHGGLAKEERVALRKKADKLIVAIEKGSVPADQQDVANRISGLVINSRISRQGFQVFLNGLEKKMCALADTLGPAEWIKQIRGVGILSLATIVGECGDLSNYANPGKLWKRLGLAPFNGKMPSTWRYGNEGTLTADQWTDLGYSPRRRSAAWMIGWAIMMQNDGVYRDRFDEAKLKSKANEQHSEWSDGRHNSHAMLLATKRFVLDLWKQWNGR